MKTFTIFLLMSIFWIAVFFLAGAHYLHAAELGVCVTMVDGACTEFVVLNNLVSSDPSTFDWEYWRTLFGGIMALYITGLAIGYIIKPIKKGSRL